MRICVYGASSNDIDQAYLNAGYELGKQMAEKKIELVFGGGATGIMGAVNRGVLENGGTSIGVAPKFLTSPAFWRRIAPSLFLRIRCGSANRKWRIWPTPLL